MKSRSVAGFMVGAIASFVACYSQTAIAGFRVFPASNCQYQTDFIGDYLLNTGDIYNISSGVGARPRTVSCPLTTDNTMTPQSMTIVAVDISDKDATQQVFAQACAAPYNAALSRSCGALSATGQAFDAGWVQLHLDRTAVNAPSAFYTYVSVELPPNTGLTSRLRGVQLVN